MEPNSFESLEDLAEYIVQLISASWESRRQVHNACDENIPPEDQRFHHGTQIIVNVPNKHVDDVTKLINLHSDAETIFECSEVSIVGTKEEEAFVIARCVTHHRIVAAAGAAVGFKCHRCWRVFKPNEFGHIPGHPAVCDRCGDAVDWAYPDFEVESHQAILVRKGGLAEDVMPTPVEDEVIDGPDQLIFTSTHLDNYYARHPEERDIIFARRKG